jgi:hypothetical protein
MDEWGVESGNIPNTFNRKNRWNLLEEIEQKSQDTMERFENGELGLNEPLVVVTKCHTNVMEILKSQWRIEDSSCRTPTSTAFSTFCPRKSKR